MKRRHKVRLSSDDWTSEVELELTPYQRLLLLDIARQVNAAAKWSVDVRIDVVSGSAAPQGDAA